MARLASFRDEVAVWPLRQFRYRRCRCRCRSLRHAVYAAPSHFGLETATPFRKPRSGSPPHNHRTPPACLHVRIGPKPEQDGFYNVLDAMRCRRVCGRVPQTGLPHCSRGSVMRRRRHPWFLVRNLVDNVQAQAACGAATTSPLGCGVWRRRTTTRLFATGSTCNV
jgi:hypothetical protein